MIIITINAWLSSLKGSRHLNTKQFPKIAKLAHQNLEFAYTHASTNKTIYKTNTRLWRYHWSSYRFQFIVGEYAPFYQTSFLLEVFVTELIWFRIAISLCTLFRCYFNLFGDFDAAWTGRLVLTVQCNYTPHSVSLRQKAPKLAGVRHPERQSFCMSSTFNTNYEREKQTEVGNSPQMIFWAPLAGAHTKLL